MGEEEVGAFDSLVPHSLGLSARPSMSQPPGCSILTDLARRGKVAASTQNQALSALLFDSFAPRLSRPLGLPV